MAIRKLLHELHRMPTHAELAQECNISEETVRRHIGSIGFDPTAVDRVDRLFADDLLSAMLMAGLNGKVMAAKLWFKMTGIYDDKAGSVPKPSGAMPEEKRRVIILPSNGRDDGK